MKGWLRFFLDNLLNDKSYGTLDFSGSNDPEPNFLMNVVCSLVTKLILGS